MSAMLALKQNGHVYVASDTMNRRGDTQIHAVHPNNYRVFKLKGSKNSVGCNIEGIASNNIIKCNDILGENEDITYENLVLDVVPKMFSLLEQRHQIDTKDGGYTMNSCWLFANKESIFEVGFDGAVMEHPNYTAIGSPCEIIMGSLASSEDIEDPLKRIEIAMRAANERDIYIRFPIVVMDTTTCEYTLIEE